jgi:GT2 family glycosyltransferase
LNSGLTIAIPTYKRSKILYKALRGYLHLEHLDRVTIMIIDNNPEYYEGTARIAQQFRERGLSINYVREFRTGLSFAKNRAVQECKTSHILFLDDDCYPEENIVKECIKWIDNMKVGAVVGKVLRWDEEVPVWIHNDLFIHNQPSLVCEDLISSSYINGGIMLINLDALCEVELFDVELGMNGSSIGYGEDTKIFNQIIAKGLRIKYDPSIMMYHTSHQESLMEFIHSFYKRGVSLQKIRPLESSHAIYIKLLKSILQTPRTFVYYVPKSYFKASVLMAVREVFVNLGILSSQLRLSSKDKPVKQIKTWM